MSLALLAVPLLLQSAVHACPLFSCVEMPKNQCGNRLSNNEIQIAARECEDGYHCSVFDFQAWILSSDQEFLCAQNVETSGASKEWTYQPCGTKQTQKDWKVGGTQLLCTQDSDCLKADDTFETGACTCVPRSDGKGVCKPDPSNIAVFGAYWKECEDEENRLTDEENYNYWAFTLQNWAYTQSDLACISTFLELQTYDELLDDYDHSALLAVAAVLTSF